MAPTRGGGRRILTRILGTLAGVFPVLPHIGSGGTTSTRAEFAGVAPHWLRSDRFGCGQTLSAKVSLCGPTLAQVGPLAWRPDSVSQNVILGEECGNIEKHEQHYEQVRKMVSPHHPPEGHRLHLQGAR